MKTGICAIAADWELPYIMEWLEYHIAIGIDNFLLFLNDWEQEKVKKLEELIRLKGFPENTIRLVKDFNGQKMQMAAYNQGLAIMTALGIDWCGFFDLDEFIKVRSTRKLSEILAKYNKAPALCINWRLFGSSGIEKVEDAYDPDPLDITTRYSVLDRFTKCEKNLNQHVKQIVNLNYFRGLNRLPEFLNPHFTNFGAVNLQGQFVFGPFNQTNLTNVQEVELNHYRTKSREECRIRRSHIRADTGGLWEEGWEQFFLTYDKNDIDESELEWK